MVNRENNEDTEDEEAEEGEQLETILGVNLSTHFTIFAVGNRLASL